MSAYSSGPPGHIISLNKPGSEPASGATAAPSEGLFDRLGDFMAATKQLEAAIGQERARAQKAHEELKQIHAFYDRLLKEREVGHKELMIQEGKLKASLKEELEETRTKERRLQERVGSLESEYKKTRDELARYKAAWAEIRQREHEAKLIVAEGRRSRDRIEDLEAQNRKLEEHLRNERTSREQAERHSKSYQLDLQNALLRIHSAEAKFAELSKEYQALNEAKRNFDEEVAKVERFIKERYEWSVAREREKMRSELEKAAAADQERFREGLKQSYRAEVDRGISFEREKLAKKYDEMDEEIRRLKSAVEQAKLKASSLEAELEAEKKRSERASERARLELQQLSEARDEEIRMVRIESETAQAELTRAISAQNRYQAMIREYEQKAKNGAARIAEGPAPEVLVAGPEG